MVFSGCSPLGVGCAVELSSAPHSSVAVRDRERRKAARAQGHRGINGRGPREQSERGKAAVYAAKGSCACARGATVRTSGGRRKRGRPTAPTRATEASRAMARNAAKTSEPATAGALTAYERLRNFSAQCWTNRNHFGISTHCEEARPLRASTSRLSERTRKFCSPLGANMRPYRKAPAAATAAPKASHFLMTCRLKLAVLILFGAGSNQCAWCAWASADGLSTGVLAVAIFAGMGLAARLPPTAFSSSVRAVQ